MPRQHGFSLTETLLAVGTLAVGLVFIAGTFMAGIYFTTVSTERTIAAVVADEAFAKIQLYGFDPNDSRVSADGFVPYEKVTTDMPVEEFLYPSVEDTNDNDSQYSWAALCRRVSPESRLVQVSVFVSRRAGTNTRYQVRPDDPDSLDLQPSKLPRPVRMTVRQNTSSADTDEVTIIDAVSSDDIDENSFINDGSILVDDETGQIYRVLERYAADPADTIKLDRPWDGPDITSAEGGDVWVISPAAEGGRSPGIAVYERVLRF